jgi:hypothetical protein
MPNTPEQAIAAARTQSAHGPQFGVGQCLMRCRLAYGIDVIVNNAALSWRGNPTKHVVTDLTKIPRGVPWSTGPAAGRRRTRRHLSGRRLCWSTDIKRPGFFDKVPIALISQTWPKLHLAGWSEHLNGVRVFTPPGVALRTTAWTCRTTTRSRTPASSSPRTPASGSSTTRPPRAPASATRPTRTVAAWSPTRAAVRRVPLRDTAEAARQLREGTGTVLPQDRRTQAGRLPARPRLRARHVRDVEPCEADPVRARLGRRRREGRGRQAHHLHAARARRQLPLSPVGGALPPGERGAEHPGPVERRADPAVLERRGRHPVARSGARQGRPEQDPGEAVRAADVVSHPEAARQAGTEAEARPSRCPSRLRRSRSR